MTPPFLGGDAAVMRTAALLLHECHTRDAALNAVRSAMEAPGTDRAWWQRVYDAVEDLGTVCDAIRKGSGSR